MQHDKTCKSCAPSFSKPKPKITRQFQTLDPFLFLKGINVVKMTELPDHTTVAIYFILKHAQKSYV